MHRFTQRGVMLFALLTLPPAVLAERRTTSRITRDVQNGWTLTGTITTDGTQGIISSNEHHVVDVDDNKGSEHITTTSTDPGTRWMYTGGNGDQGGAHRSPPTETSGPGILLLGAPNSVSVVPPGGT